MRPVLYSLQGSPNAWVARLALRHKGIRFRRVDLPQALHRPILRSLGFPGQTVPALEIEGRRPGRVPPLSGADHLAPLRAG